MADPAGNVLYCGDNLDAPPAVCAMVAARSSSLAPRVAICANLTAL
jgi:hypothetical protein